MTKNISKHFLNNLIKTITAIVVVLFLLKFYFRLNIKLESSSLQVSGFLILISISLSFMASFLRVKRSKLLFDLAQPGSVNLHLQAWSVGSLINLLSGYRIGELVRIYFLRKKLRISFIFSFFVIVIERLVDVVILGASALLVAAYLPPGTFPEIYVNSMVKLFVPAFLVTSIVIFLFCVESKILRNLSRIQEKMNIKFGDRTKHSYWTYSYGIRRITQQPMIMTKYCAYCLGSWFATLLSVISILQLNPTNNSNFGIILEKFVKFQTSSSVFSIPSVPKYVNGNGSLVLSLQESVDGDLMWFSLNSLVCVFGIYTLFILLSRTSSGMSREFSDNTKLHALDRSNRDLAPFIDSFFANYDLARELVSQEIRNKEVIVGSYAGGSEALTVLVKNSSADFLVKKIEKTGTVSNLERQFYWLQKYSNLDYIVDSRNFEVGNGFDSYSMPLIDSSQSFFRYVHKVPVEKSWESLENLLDSMQKDIWIPDGELVGDDVEKYISTTVETRLNSAKNLHPELARISAHSWFSVNGIRLNSFEFNLRRVMESKEVLRRLSRLERTKGIHGDLTLDNMLVNNLNKVILIDPSNLNTNRSRLSDLSRTWQSLGGGYEFLNRIKSNELIISSDARSIDFEDQTSTQYFQLGENFRKYVSTTHSIIEAELLDFFSSLYLVRMLPHRVRIAPTTVLAYYARSCQLLDRFVKEML